MSMETKEREAYRMMCRYYGYDGGCGKRPYVKGINAFNSMGIVILCTPDCDCARMKRYDKLNKDKI